MKNCLGIWLFNGQPHSDVNGQWQRVLWQSWNARFPTQTTRGIENWKMHAIKQINICAEYRGIVPVDLTGLSGTCTPGLRPSLIARFMGPTWGPSGADRTQVRPMLVPWTLLSGLAFGNHVPVSCTDLNLYQAYLPHWRKEEWNDLYNIYLRHRGKKNCGLGNIIDNIIFLPDRNQRQLSTFSSLNIFLKVRQWRHSVHGLECTNLECPTAVCRTLRHTWGVFADAFWATLALNAFAKHSNACISCNQLLLKNDTSSAILSGPVRSVHILNYKSHVCHLIQNDPSDNLLSPGLLTTPISRPRSPILSQSMTGEPEGRQTIWKISTCIQYNLKRNRLRFSASIVLAQLPSWTFEIWCLVQLFRTPARCPF